MALRFRPLDAPFGAEVVGVDLSRDVDAGTLAEIEAAWYRYSILLFRGVDDDAGAARRLHAAAGTAAHHGAAGVQPSRTSRSAGRLERREGQQADRHEARRMGMAFRRRRQGAAERRLVHPRAQAAARRTATRCTPTRTPRSRRCPTTCGARSWGAARAFRRARFHEVYYPHLPPLTRRAEKSAAGCLASDRAPASANPAGRRSISAAGRTRSTACRMTKRRS